MRKSSRSEEHTSELQSLRHLVCRLLLEKKKTTRKNTTCPHAATARLERRARDAHCTLRRGGCAVRPLYQRSCLAAQSSFFFFFKRRGPPPISPFSPPPPLSY